MFFYCLYCRIQVAGHSICMCSIVVHTARQSPKVVVRACPLNQLFLLDYNCFTMSHLFLLYNKVNQLYVYTYHLPLKPPSPSISFMSCLQKLKGEAFQPQLERENANQEMSLPIPPHMSDLKELEFSSWLCSFLCVICIVTFHLKFEGKTNYTYF